MQNNTLKFSEWLEQRDPELYEQMFNEGIHDIIGKGVDWIQKKNREYFPDQVRKDGKWINKPVEPQAQQQAAPAKQQDQQAPNVDDNYLRSFKVLYNAVKERKANDDFFDGFAPASLRGNPKARQEWAVQQLMYGAKASQNLGLTAHATFSGSLLWHTFHPWPQRPDGLVDEGFKELAKRWLPILNYFDECGVDVCYEIHPGEDLFDGITYEMFLEKVNNHKRACLLYDPSHFVLQQLDYIEYIDLYHERIKAFHVKDSEFNPSGRQGTFGGYQSWLNRAGRYRSPGDGQVDFKTIFSKLTQYGYNGWAVMEWECCIKHPEDGAREGSEFIKNHIIRVTDKTFDDFAGGGSDVASNRRILGLD